MEKSFIKMKIPPHFKTPPNCGKQLILSGKHRTDKHGNVYYKYNCTRNDKTRGQRHFTKIGCVVLDKLDEKHVPTAEN